MTAWSRPDLALAAPAGIAALAPAALVASAGNASTLVAGQDMQFAAQAHHAWAVKSGLVVHTYGKATVAATRLTADKSVAVSSDMSGRSKGADRPSGLDATRITAAALIREWFNAHSLEPVVVTPFGATTVCVVVHRKLLSGRDGSDRNEVKSDIC